MTPEERADLEQRFVLALLKRDSLVWHRRFNPMNSTNVAPADGSITKPESEPSAPSKPLASHTYKHEDACPVCGSFERRVIGDRCIRCEKVAEKAAAAVQRAAAKRVAKAEADERMANLGKGLRPTQQWAPSVRRSQIQAAAAVTPPTLKAEPPLAYRHQGRWATS